jgi:hypothetical protein
MALIKCKECGADISSKAAACPKCGAKLPKPTSGCAIVGATVFGAIVLATVYQSQNAPESTPAEQAAFKRQIEWRSAIYKAEAEIPKILKDPDSAKFSDVVAVDDDKGGFAVCGKVNAKNSFGAYIGAKSFIYLFGRAHVEGEADFSKTWNAHCANRISHS